VKYRQSVLALIRVAFSIPRASDLSRKFGCEPEAVCRPISAGGRLRIKITACRFHVGSQAAGPAMVVEAIAKCSGPHAPGRSRWDTLPVSWISAAAFPVDYLQSCMPIEEFCAPIRARCRNSRPRYASSLSRAATSRAGGDLVTSVMGREHIATAVGGTISTMFVRQLQRSVYDHATYPVEAAGACRRDIPFRARRPTCDSIDVINERLRNLPKLRRGRPRRRPRDGWPTLGVRLGIQLLPPRHGAGADGGRLLTDRGRSMPGAAPGIGAGGALAACRRRGLLAGTARSRENGGESGLQPGAKTVNTALLRRNALPLLNLHTTSAGME